MLEFEASVYVHDAMPCHAVPCLHQTLYSARANGKEVNDRQVVNTIDDDDNEMAVAMVVCASTMVASICNLGKAHGLQRYVAQSDVSGSHASSVITPISRSHPSSCVPGT